MSRPPRPRCVTCGTPIRGAFIGTPVHSQACGHLLALRLTQAVPGVIDLLPVEWRKDRDDADEPGVRPGLHVPHRLADREAKR